jgi:hypothetical protein
VPPSQSVIVLFNDIRPYLTWLSNALQRILIGISHCQMGVYGLPRGSYGSCDDRWNQRSGSAPITRSRSGVLSLRCQAQSDEANPGASSATAWPALVHFSEAHLPCIYIKPLCGGHPPHHLTRQLTLPTFSTTENIRLEDKHNTLMSFPNYSSLFTLGLSSSSAGPSKPAPVPAPAKKSTTGRRRSRAHSLKSFLKLDTRTEPAPPMPALPIVTPHTPVS